MNKNCPKKYFLVTAMCGHVGKLKYVPVNFPVIAPCASDASQMVKSFPRVKKHRKDRIIACKEITHEEYLAQRATNRADPYLNSKCRRDAHQNESLSERVCSLKKRRHREEQPLSMKYRQWKYKGRYLAAACYGGYDYDDED